jgi:hypothetical protein
MASMVTSIMSSHSATKKMRAPIRATGPVTLERAVIRAATQKQARAMDKFEKTYRKRVIG